jgi:hypothetical protein
MGCNTCKQSNSGLVTEIPSEDTIKLLPSDLSGSSFLFRLIAFFVITIAIPLVVLVLIGQMFFAFFIPKKLDVVTIKFKKFLMGIFTKYAEFKLKRKLKKREIQFKKTTEYISKDIDDVEIYDNKEKNNE